MRLISHYDNRSTFGIKICLLFHFKLHAPKDIYRTTLGCTRHVNLSHHLAKIMSISPLSPQSNQEADVENPGRFSLPTLSSLIHLLVLLLHIESLGPQTPGLLAEWSCCPVLWVPVIPFVWTFLSLHTLCSLSWTPSEPALGTRVLCLRIRHTTVRTVGLLAVCVGHGTLSAMVVVKSLPVRVHSTSLTWFSPISTPLFVAGVATTHSAQGSWPF